MKSRRLLLPLTPLLLAGCRITGDMPLEQKIAVGFVDVILIAAAVFAVMLANYWISTKL